MHLSLLSSLFLLTTAVTAGKPAHHEWKASAPEKPAGYVESLLFPYSAVTFRAITRPIHVAVDLFFKRPMLQTKSEELGTKLNAMPTYANYTDGHWNVFVHGNAQIIRNISNDQLDHLIDRVLIRARVPTHSDHLRVRNETKLLASTTHRLSGAEHAIARARVRDLSYPPQKYLNVSVHLKNSDGHGGLDKECKSFGQQLADPTGPDGGFDDMIMLPTGCGPRVNDGPAIHDVVTGQLQIFDTKNLSAAKSSAPVSFVPPRGLSITSDIDDVLRVAEVWNPKQTILSTFARVFVAWSNMPSVFARWKDIPGVHFHYSTDAPEHLAEFYTRSITAGYPSGSFDFRPMDFSDPRELFTTRETNLRRLFESFPERQHVLIGDTSTPSVMKSYPRLMKEFPNVQCLLIRDVQTTEPSDWCRPDTSGFADLPENKYFFFKTPDDLSFIPQHHFEALSTLPPNATYTLASGVKPMIVPNTAKYVGERYKNSGCFPFRASPDSLDFRTTKQ